MFAAVDVIAKDAGARTARPMKAGPRKAGATNAAPHVGPRVGDWDSLDEPLQLLLAGAALRRVAATFTFQAETLARDMESGGLQDRGGPDALRLFSNLIRILAEDGLGCVAVV